VRLFQFDVYDEYVYNAIGLLRYLIYRQSIDARVHNATSATQLDSEGRFESLHGYAATDAAQNVLTYFSLWDFDPTDGLFHPAMEQTDPPRGQLVAVGNRAIHWPGGGDPPAPDYCAFNDCSTSTVVAVTLVCTVTVSQ